MGGAPFDSVPAVNPVLIGEAIPSEVRVSLTMRKPTAMVTKTNKVTVISDFVFKDVPSHNIPSVKPRGSS